MSISFWRSLGNPVAGYHYAIYYQNKKDGSCAEAWMMPIFSVLSSLEEKCFIIAQCYQDTELCQTSGCWQCR